MKTKVKPLLRWLRDSTPEPEAVARLHGIAGKMPMDYPSLARMFNEADRGHLVVLDTSFLGRQEIDWCVWEALLGQTIAIPRYTWRELEAWRKSPFANKRIADILNAAETEQNPAILLDHQQPWGKHCRYGRSYYNTLLAQRKRRARPIVEDFEARNGWTATRKDLDQLFTKQGRERDFHFLWKGYKDRYKDNFFADEDVVVTGVMAGLESGRSTTILTRDGDLLEQFYKLCALLTMHYQALLFADWYAAAPEMFPLRPLSRGITALEHYFDCSDGLLVKKPVADPARLTAVLLPVVYRPVWLSCFLFGGQPPEMSLTVYGFVAEQGMRRVFRVKGATKGLSTGRLGGMNCHVTGLPVGIEDSRQWVAVVTDKVLAFKNGPLRIPLLESLHNRAAGG